MISSIASKVWNFLLPRTEPVAARKRPREDSDGAEPGELAKRLRSMTETRMAGTLYHQVGQTGDTSSNNEVEVVWPTQDSSGLPRLCFPRRPGHRLASAPHPPATESGQLPVVRHVPVVVERDVPVLVEADAPTRRRRDEQPRQPPQRRRAAGVVPRPPVAAAATAGATADVVNGDSGDDVLIIGEKKLPQQAAPPQGFFGLRSFREMVETGRVAGRASPARRRQQQKQRSPTQKRSLFDKLIGITPNKLTRFRRGMSTFDCFRLEEKRRYQALLSEYSSVSSHLSAIDVSTAFRTKSVLASTPVQQAVCAVSLVRLDPATTARLARRISTVDLASSASDGSPPPFARTSIGSDADPRTPGNSRQASVVSDSDVSVMIEKVVPARPRRTTQLDEDLQRQLKHACQLREKYAVSQRHRQQQIREEEARRAISQDNHVQWEQGLTSRMRRQMRLTPRVALEAELELSEEEEEEVLPELTPAMQTKISAALRPSPSTEIMAEAFNQRLTRHDLQTLKGLNWLNDEVINFYMNMIMERNKTNNKLPKVYCFNTFFYGKIVSQGHSSVKRWTRKVDIFAHDLLVIPVHLGMHWCLACVDRRLQTVRYLDSMGGNNNRGLDAILRYLRDEHSDKKKAPLDTSAWQAVNEKDIPQQMNGSDCGMFACKFAEYLSRDASITFTQEDMPYFRRRMVYEIVTKTLL